MPTIELGVFLAFIGASAGSIIFSHKVKYLVMLAPAVLGGLAMMFFANYQVVLTVQHPQTTTIATGSTVARDNQSNIITNMTKTATVTIPAYNDQVPIIDSNQNTFAWVFLAASLIMTYLIAKEWFNI